MQAARTSRLVHSLSALAVALLLIVPALRSALAADADPMAATILKSAESAKLLPSAVFFRGLSASTQLRNSGGIKFGDGMFVFATLVDTSGYSTSIQQKYQAYFITEVPLDIEGQHLVPGAYGIGFIADNKFIVLDIGAHDLFTVASTKDAAIARPTPLQFLADSTAGATRLYVGRNYVTLKRASQ